MSSSVWYWSCPSCGYRNKKVDTTCQVCDWPDLSKPSHGLRLRNKQFRPSEIRAENASLADPLSQVDAELRRAGNEILDYGPRVEDKRIRGRRAQSPSTLERRTQPSAPSTSPRREARKVPFNYEAPPVELALPNPVPPRPRVFQDYQRSQRSQRPPSPPPPPTQDTPETPERNSVPEQLVPPDIPACSFGTETGPISGIIEDSDTNSIQSYTCNTSCTRPCLRVKIAYAKSYQRMVLHQLELHYRDNDDTLLNQMYRAFDTRHGFFRRHFSFKALQSIEVRKYKDHTSFFNSSNIELASGPSRFVTLDPCDMSSVAAEFNSLCPHLTYDLLHPQSRSSQRWIQITAILAEKSPDHTFYLHEDWSLVRVSWNAFVWVVVSTAVSVVWTTVAGGDVQSGFALGSYLVAVGAFGIGILAYVEMRNGSNDGGR
ncbi:hypothetical protein EDC01DRAFT_650027 [Geopyxis carbonaria]|nr:hypothetical protein EDC01DRAFT_650027 [Geopyxis carbonaria]